MTLDIDREYDRIYRYCYYRLRSREEAEDVTQETFLRYFASDTYQDTGRTLQYLYTIARNLCIDERWRPLTQPLPEDLPPEGGDPLDEDPRPPTFPAGFVFPLSLLENR